MQSRSTNRAEQYVKTNRRRSVWKKVVSILASVVVFCTTYALILPAITLEASTECPLDEHAHTIACYSQILTETAPVLTCTQTEQPHVHTDDCYVPIEAATQSCGLEETQGHSHVAECYDADSQLICTLEETEGHSHNDSCLTLVEGAVLSCAIEETTGHTHAAECYDADSQLICTQEETEAHSHNATCYTVAPQLQCELVTEPHEHTDECYTQSEIPVDFSKLYCGLEETDGHSHEQSCYDENWQLICTQQTEAHSHSELCYGKWELTCGLEEHSHSSHAVANTANSPVPAGSRLNKITGVNYYTYDTETTNHAFIIDDRKNENRNAKQILAEINAAAGETKDYSKVDFKYHTAVIVEALYEKAPYTQDVYDAYLDGPEYFVDAVITGEFDKGNIVPRTTNGFILYIWPYNSTETISIPQRGDYVNPNFWYGDLIYPTVDPVPDDRAYYLEKTADGNNLYADVYVNSGGFGYLVYTDDLTAKIIDVNTLSDDQLAMNINATAKLFNYDATINSQGLGTVNGAGGYVFWQGDWGNGAHLESVDGWCGENDHGIYEWPIMADTLDANGYPQMTNGGSMAYLFNGTSTRANGSSTLVGTMSNGGGLFRVDKDGYYYYDSLQNAAYFNGSRFILYDNLAVRPWYDSDNGEKTSYGNFLPFNKVTTDNVIADEEFNKIHDYQDPPQLYQMPDSIKNQLLKGTQFDRSDLDGVTSVRLEDKVDLGFGMQLDFEFVMPEDGKVNGQDMIFNFHGDDDVYIYIGVWDEVKQAYDYRLAVDLGGIHGARTGTINFATGKTSDYPALGEDGKPRTNGNARQRTFQEIFGLDGTTFDDYTKLSVKFFYLERGGNISYCRLRFNLPTLPDKSLTVTKELGTATADTEAADFLLDSLSYEFRVVQADAAGNATDTSYFSKRGEDGTTFIPQAVSYNILENGQVVGTGTVDENGAFFLKAGQSAQFSNMLDWSESGTIRYVVQEILPKNTSGQFQDTTYQIGSIAGEIITDETSADFNAYNTKALSAASMQYVIYRNQLDTTKMGTLKITKNLARGAELPADHEYEIMVKLGGVPLPVDTTYTVGEETRTVTTAGVIRLKLGETAVIQKGILAGTVYEIRELNEGIDFHATYSGSVSDGGTIECGGEGIAGTFPLGGTVNAIVTNANFAFAVELPISKTAVGNSTSAQFGFIAERVEAVDGDWTVLESLPGLALITADDSAVTGSLFIGFAPEDAGEFYFRIREQAGDGSFIYDDTYYIVKVIAADGVATIAEVLKNGTEALDTAATLSFRNYRTTSITVTKTVVNGGEGAFPFEVIVTLDGEPFPLLQPAEDAGYTVSDNVITFQLAHGESITIPNLPIGATVTVTETQHRGFNTACDVSGNRILGDSATVQSLAEPTVFAFTNESGYELPATGGMGTFFFTFGGAALTAAPLLYILSRKRKQEGRAAQ